MTKQRKPLKAKRYYWVVVYKDTGVMEEDHLFLTKQECAEWCWSDQEPRRVVITEWEGE